MLKDAAARGVHKVHLAEPGIAAVMRRGTNKMVLRMRENYPIGTLLFAEDAAGRVFAEIIGKTLNPKERTITYELRVEK